MNPSTYWRAMSCADPALREAARKLTALSERDPERLAAEVVRHRLNPRFALLFAGEMEGDTFAAQGPRVTGRREKKRPDKGGASETARELRGGRKSSGGPSGQSAASAESGSGKRP